MTVSQLRPARRAVMLFTFSSGLLLAVLMARPVAALQITEILYHPPEDDDPDGDPNEPAGGRGLEWLELYNESGTAYDLSEHFFSEGIRFFFPEGTAIDGRTRIIICSDVEAFRARYPAASLEGRLYGPFEGRLDNGGERITLANSTGSPVASVRYSDEWPWPAHADGAGYSLALRRPLLDMSRAENWTHSTLRGGTPGDENFPPPTFVDHPLFDEMESGRTWRLRKGWDPSTSMIAEFSEPLGAWTDPDFDDSSWTQVVGPVGFGEDEITTVLDDMEDNYLAFALRGSFDLTPEIFDELQSLRFEIARDDGVIVWLNGAEVGRDGIPGSAGEFVSAGERANRSGELSRTAATFTIPKDSLRSGTNQIAIEVHNINIGSSDCGVSVAAFWRSLVVTEKPPLLPVRVNEVELPSTRGTGFVELVWNGTTEVDLAGLGISVGGDEEIIALEAGSIVSPEEPFLVVPLETPSTLPNLRVFVTTADGAHVLDAAVARAPAEDPGTAWSFARLPDGRGRWWVSTQPTPGAANVVPREEDVVINEIHYHPFAREDALEFVELYNRGNRAVDLSGFAFTDGLNHVFAPGTMLAPGAYLVVARDPAALRETYGLAGVAIVGPPPGASPEEIDAFGSLSNGGERIVLRDPIGNPVDEVDYLDGGSWPGLADGGGSSLELIDPFQDNSSPHAWEASDESDRSEWKEYSIEGLFRTLPPASMESELQIYGIEPGEFLLDEVSIRETNSPDRELVSNPSFETDTRPWRLIGTHIRSDRTTLDAHDGTASLHVVASGSGDQKVNHIEIDTSPAIRTNQDVRIHFWARWLRGSNAVHVMLYNNVLADTVFLPVPADAGTPGRENGARVRLRNVTGSDNLGPVIDAVRHSPAVPGPSLPVTITARVSDSDGIEKAEILWREDASVLNDPAVDYQRAPLFDDGAHDDGAAGDGIWGGTLPGGSIRTRYQFAIEATDTLGHVRAFPDPFEPLVFICDETFPDPARPHELLRYRLVLDTDNNQELTRRLLHSDELVRGTFVFEEEEVFYNVGLRYRGSPWNRPPTPRMFRLRLPDDKPLRGTQRRVNLSRYGDDQNEGIGYQLIRKMSRPWAKAPHAPHYEYIDINLNGIAHTPGHPMAEVQPVDSGYVDFWWPEDSEGWTYKITGKLAFDDGGSQKAGSPDWTRFRWYGDSEEDVRFYFSPGVRSEDDRLDPVVDFLRVFDARQTPAEEFASRLRSVMNLESSFRVFVCRDLIGDWDTIGIGNGQNAYLYYAPIEQRMYLLPWDMDHAFEQSGQQMLASADPGFGRMFREPEVRRIYARVLEEGLEGAFSPQVIDRWADRINTVTGPARTINPANIKSFLATRRSLANSLLRSAQRAEFALLSGAVVPFTGGVATLEGTAPLEVESVAIVLDDSGDVIFPELRWRTESGRPTDIATIWELDIEGLTKSSHTVQVFAFSSAGDLAGNASATLLDTTGWLAPVIDSIEPTSGVPEGGTTVTLRGHEFRTGAVVTFGEEVAATVIESSSVAHATSPPGTEAATVDIELRNVDGQSAVVENAFSYVSTAPVFLRGDADVDGSLSLTDAIVTLDFLFRGTGLVNCADAADSDDNGSINLSDPIKTLRVLFIGDPPLPPPNDVPGIDPTPDGLGCAQGL